MARGISRQEETLFLDDSEVAGRIANHLGRSLQTWRGIAIVLEREGFPKVDPLFGGRYWPACREFLDARYGLRKSIPSAPDGTENLDALR